MEGTIVLKNGRNDSSKNFASSQDLQGEICLFSRGGSLNIKHGPDLSFKEKINHWGQAAPWLSGSNPRYDIMPVDGDYGFLPATGNELVWYSNPILRDWLKEHAGASQLDKLKWIYYVINKSPWSSLDENKAFLTTADSAIKLLTEAIKPVAGWKGLEYRAAFPVQTSIFQMWIKWNLN